MKLRTFTVNPLEVNCYVAWDDTLEGVIIDCGCYGKEEFEQIENFIREQGIRLVHHLLTHAHFDHIWASDSVLKTFDLQPECHKLEQKTWANNPTLTKASCGIELPMPDVEPQFTLNDGDEVQFGSTTLKMLHTPGHTPGGICYYCEKEGILLSGDTLFRHSVGRADLPLGNFGQEILSIRHLLATLPEATKVYPGHGEPTTIGEEMRFNPYI